MSQHTTYILFTLMAQYFITIALILIFIFSGNFKYFLLIYLLLFFNCNSQWWRKEIFSFFKDRTLPLLQLVCNNILLPQCDQISFIESRVNKGQMYVILLLLMIKLTKKLFSIDFSSKHYA